MEAPPFTASACPAAINLAPSSEETSMIVPPNWLMVGPALLTNSFTFMD